MNEIVHRFLLAGGKFMPEMHLRQPGFTYSVCGPFTKNKERIKKFKEAGDSRYIYQNELDKACFQDKAFNIAKNPKADGHQRGLTSMVYKFFDKKTSATCANKFAGSKAMSTKGLTKYLINKFSILSRAIYFSSGIVQNCLVFTPAKKYIKYLSGTTRIDSWKYNVMSEENIENITRLGSSFAPTFVDHNILPDMNFNGHCLINNIYIPKKVINMYISYALNPWLRNVKTDFTLHNCLFGSVKLTKNADPDKYKYSGYGIGFDSRLEFSFTDGSMGKNVIIFGADMSSFVHIDNKNKDVLILGEGPTQGLDDTTLTAEVIYPITFTQPNKRFVLSLRYNGSNSFLFVNATKIYQFKARDSEIKDYALCLGNISKDFTINNLRKT